MGLNIITIWDNLVVFSNQSKFVKPANYNANKPTNNSEIGGAFTDIRIPPLLLKWLRDIHKVNWICVLESREVMMQSVQCKEERKGKQH